MTPDPPPVTWCTFPACRSSTATSPIRHDLVQRPWTTTSQLWLDGLRASGRENDQCVSALHTLLLRVARHEVLRRSGSLQLQVRNSTTSPSRPATTRSWRSGPRSRASVATAGSLPGRTGSSCSRSRRRWAGTSGGHVRAWTTRPGTGCQTLSSRAGTLSEHRELFAVLRRAIDEELTQLQRQVFVAIALNGVPWTRSPASSGRAGMRSTSAVRRAAQAAREPANGWI